MANYTGADVITTSDITKYQPDAFSFGIATSDTETTNFLAQTTNDILRQLRIECRFIYPIVVILSGGAIPLILTRRTYEY